MPGSLVNLPPGGVPAPWNSQPPNNSAGGQPVRALNFAFIPGQLPTDTGGGTPAPGDTQVGYPSAPATPAAPTYAFAAGQALVIDYQEAGASVTTVTEGIDPPAIRLYLGAGAMGPAVPGSVRFTFRGRTYVDRAGALYYGIDPVTNAGTLGGSYDYTANVATLSDYASSGGNTVTIVSLATRYAETGVGGVMFRTAGAPLSEGNFTLRATTMDGVELTATADINGTITGTTVKGKVDWPSGIARVAFGAMVVAAGNESQPWYDADLVDGSGNIWRPTSVDPSSIFYGAVVSRAIPVDPTLIGIDPVRLPGDGRVPGFNPGTPAIVSHTQVTTLTPVADAVTDLGRERISFIDIFDSSVPALPIDDVWYVLDLEAGTVTWANPLNLSAYTMPVVIRDRIQDVALIADVQITGEITLASELTHNYPDGTIISNAIDQGDLQARYANLFDQATYTAGEWSDTVVGSPAAASYNDVVNPILVANDSAIDERWAVVFIAPTTVNVIGETTGQVLSQSITSDLAPINPVSGQPYFTIDKDGWGSGWSAGNVLRFNTISATKPIWAARVRTPGSITVPNDRVRLQSYGNANP